MNPFATLCLALAVFGGGDEKDGKQKLEVRVKPTVAVRGLDVAIGELCEITPAGREALAVAQLTFGRAPVHGYVRTISRLEIVQALAAAGHDVGTFKFEGALETTVQAMVVDVPGSEVLDAATAALQALLAIEGGDVEYEAPPRVRLIQAPPGRRSQELQARVRGGRTGPNSAVVDVDVLVDGASCKKVPLTFKLVRFQQVLKTTGAIRAGTPLGADNLGLVREPMAQATGLFLDDMVKVEGLVASRNLQANQRLTLGDAAMPALIHKGDIVTVVLNRGRVKVTIKAMANHDAPLTGRITLTNLQSRSTLSGVVAAPGLVVAQ